MEKNVIMQVTHKDDYYLVKIDELGGFSNSAFLKEIAIQNIQKEFVKKILLLSLTNDVPSKYLQDFNFIEK